MPTNISYAIDTACLSFLFSSPPSLFEVTKDDSFEADVLARSLGLFKPDVTVSRILRRSVMSDTTLFAGRVHYRGVGVLGGCAVKRCDGA